jgi:hypothetical protein
MLPFLQTRRSAVCLIALLSLLSIFQAQNASAASSLFLDQPPRYPAGGSNAVAVAVGDFNRDGKLDAVVANSNTNNIGVLLNNGNGFQAAVGYSVGRGPTAVAVGDLNGDGWLDLVVANSTDGTVSVLLGNGDGTFRAAVNFAVGRSPSSIAIADFNHDGRPDLAVANQSDGTVAMLLGSGDGTFGTASMVYAGYRATPTSIAAGDLNSDGNLDFVVSDSANNTVNVLNGNGDGTFQPPRLFSLASVPISVVVADLNADGRQDVAVASYCPVASSCFHFPGNDGVTVLLGNGDGTLQSGVTYPRSGNQASSMVSGDFNGDGVPDIAVTYLNSNTVGIFLGKGDGTLLPAISYGSGDAPMSLCVGDFNGDGKSDLVAVNNAAGSYVSLLLGDGNGRFQSAPSFDSGGQNPLAVAVADVNGDGQPDLLVTSEQCPIVGCFGTFLNVLLHQSDGTYRLAANYNHIGFPIVGDVNGDGKLDLVVVSNTPGMASVLLGNGDGTFQPAVDYASGGQAAVSVTLADVNGDGRPDLVVASGCSQTTCPGTVGVLLGNGDGTFQAAVTYGSGGQNPASLVVGDVNGDGRPDLVVANGCAIAGCTNGVVSVLVGNGDGTFQAAVAYSPGGQPALNVAIGDTNGDGKPDLIVSNACPYPSCKTAAVSVLAGNGDGTFQAPVSYSLGGPNASVVAAIDVNGDGKLDLVVENSVSVASCTNCTAAVMLGNGDGTFQPAVNNGSAYVYPGAVTVGDVNGDGKPDLLMPQLCTDSLCANGMITVLRNMAPGFRYGTSTAIVASANPVYVYQPVTFTATVTPTFNGGTITGSVTFYQRSFAIATVPVNNGQAIFTTSSLPVATYPISAIYDGDGTYLPSTSQILREAVQPRIPSATTVTSSPNPSIYGQFVTFTAHVSSSGGTPTGTVTFMNSLASLGAAPLVNGTATLTMSPTTAGSYAVTAVYSGDSTIEVSNSAPITQTVNQATSAITIASSVNPSLYNQTITFTAVVSSNSGTPPGYVTFMDGTNSLSLVTLSNGNATFSTSGLSLGSHSITANYAGHQDFTDASASVKQIVNQDPSTTALASGLNPSIAGQSVTYSATVTSQFSTPSGTLTFLDGATSLGIANLINGVASFTGLRPTAGTHSITASYNGDNYNLPSTTSLVQTVNKATTVVTLAASSNPASVNQSVSFLPLVTSQYGSSVSGTITFKQGTKTLATLPYRTPYANVFTPAGTYPISAIYSGDSQNLASTTVLNEVIVAPATTNTSVVSSINPTVIGQSVTFTASITSAAGSIPNGEVVTFYDGATATGTGTTAAGTATLTTSFLSAVPHAIKASYSGDVYFKPSFSTITEVVALAPSITNLTSSPNPSIHGQAVVLTATVTTSAPVGATGSVTFKNGTTTLATVQLVGGVATFTTKALPAGTLTITAAYNGNAQAAKSSGTTSQTVN